MAQKFTCGPDEDKELLKDPTLSFNKRNIILCRLGEKELLLWYIKFLSFALQVMEMPIDQARKAIEKIPEEIADTKVYFDM